MKMGYKDLLARADAAVKSYETSEVTALIDNPDVVLIDIRDPRELERAGMIPGAHHAPRGMLEFWIDPDCPYHKEYFAEDKEFVFYCASGWRSLLAAEVAQEMGLRCASLRGGFGDYQRAGHPIQQREHKPV